MISKFDYFRPQSVQELTELQDKYKGESKLLAGGTDLLVQMRDMVLRPKYVIDLKGIEELHEISQDDGYLRIGATVTLNEILKSEVIRERFKILWDAASVMGDPILQNQATLIGNVCNASPAADTAPALLVLGAEVEIVSSGGERIIPIYEFFKGVQKTALAGEEFVRAVRIPNLPKRAKGGYFKWRRTFGEDLSVVGVAVLSADSGKTVRIALSSVFETPLYIPEVEEIFKKKGKLDDKIGHAVKLVKEKIAPINDVRASAGYRMHMTEVLTRRALEEILKGG
jgi:carbon-monoxide dehydrogenase medium subunit